MTSKEQQLMDQAVSNKMKTITKTNANLMKKLLEDETNVNKLFKEKHYPRESITQYFDVLLSISIIIYANPVKLNERIALEDFLLRNIEKKYLLHQKLR